MTLKIIFMSKEKECDLTRVFKERLVELRKERQLTQQELADGMGIQRNIVSFFESRCKNPTLETLEQFSEFLNVPPTELLIDRNGENEKKKTGPASKLEIQFQRLQTLSAHKQRMIANMLEAAINSQ